MTELVFLIAALIIAAIIFIVVFINDKKQTKIDMYESRIEELEAVNSRLERVNNQLAEKIEEAANVKKTFRTGDDGSDFGATVSILHKYAGSGDNGTKN